MYFLCLFDFLNRQAAVSASRFFAIMFTMTGGQVWTIVRWVLATAFVALLAYYATRMMSMANRRRRGAGNLTVIESIPLGQHTFVHLIKAGEKHFVVGQTRERITLLGEVDGEELSSPDFSPLNPADTPFGKVLARFMPDKFNQNQDGSQDGNQNGNGSQDEESP